MVAEDGVEIDVTELAPFISSGKLKVHLHAAAFVTDPPPSWVIGRGPMTSDRVTAVVVVDTNFAISNVTIDGKILVAAFCLTWDGRWKKSG